MNTSKAKYVRNLTLNSVVLGEVVGLHYDVNFSFREALLTFAFLISFRVKGVASEY
jgi:hypothetical protein